MQVVVEGVNQGRIYRYIVKPLDRDDLIKKMEDSILFHRYLVRSLDMEASFSGTVLSEKERLIGAVEMAGAVCHELNQPMQIISGYSELVADARNVPDDMKRYTDEIASQVKRMADITKKLMSINRYITRKYMGDTSIIDIDRASAARRGKSD